MTDKELLDLALEALRSAAAELYRASSYCNTYEVLGNTNDAITAIQQARAAQPAPVQEPVAWMDKYGEIYKDVPEVLSTDTPLYTTPFAAQRQWVGLTDEELMQTMSGDWTSQFYFARAIEAKLKERNT
jgi:hypothetical protein